MQHSARAALMGIKASAAHTVKVYGWVARGTGGIHTKFNSKLESEPKPNKIAIKAQLEKLYSAGEKIRILLRSNLKL